MVGKCVDWSSFHQSQLSKARSGGKRRYVSLWSLNVPKRSFSTDQRSHESGVDMPVSRCILSHGPETAPAVCWDHAVMPAPVRHTHGRPRTQRGVF